MTEVSSSVAEVAVDDVVLGLWRALSRRDWDAVKTFLADDCLYADMPVPALSARGPENIVKRLKMGLEPLAAYENHDGLLVSDGPDAIYEHSETWTFPTGEQGVLRFVTVHKVVGGQSDCLERLLGHEQPRGLRAAEPLREPRHGGHQLGFRRHGFGLRSPFEATSNPPQPTMRNAQRWVAERMVVCSPPQQRGGLGAEALLTVAGRRGRDALRAESRRAISYSVSLVPLFRGAGAVRAVPAAPPNPAAAVAPAMA